MNKEIYVIHNFYTHTECDFLINYYHKYWKGYEWGESEYVRWKDAPFYHLRFNYLKWKYTRKVRKILPFLKISYGQLVKWEPGSSKPHHIDIDFPNGAHCSWTSVCYLNDNYEGGATLLEDIPVKLLKEIWLYFVVEKFIMG